MKVAIYARVSTDDKEQNPERQFLKCRQYCELHSHIVIKELVDYHTGDSRLEDREQGKELCNMNIDGIVVFSMDRLTRQHPIKVIQLINAYKDKGIKIISITEPAFNMESEFADILIYILGWFNNYFLTKLKRDVRAGMERARKQGKQIGRKQAEFNRYRAYQLLIVEKKSQRYVAKELGVSLATINRFRKVADVYDSSFINELNVSITHP